MHSRLPESIYEITPGTQLILALPGYEERIQTAFVGLERSKYFMMRMPRLEGPNIYDFIYSGSEITVRYLLRGNIWGFTSRVQSYLAKPYPLLFTDFPDKIESFNLRKEDRVECFFPITVGVGGKSITAMLMDISRSGCQISFDKDHAEGDVAVGEDIAVECPIFGATNEEQLNCQIRSVRNGGQKYTVGMIFNNPGPDISARIHDYIQQVTGLMSQ